MEEAEIIGMILGYAYWFFIAFPTPYDDRREK